MLRMLLFDLGWHHHIDTPSALFYSHHERDSAAWTEHPVRLSENVTVSENPVISGSEPNGCESEGDKRTNRQKQETSKRRTYVNSTKGTVRSNQSGTN